MFAPMLVVKTRRTHASPAGGAFSVYDPEPVCEAPGVEELILQLCAHLPGGSVALSQLAVQITELALDVAGLELTATKALAATEHGTPDLILQRRIEAALYASPPDDDDDPDDIDTVTLPPGDDDCEGDTPITINL